MTFRVPTHETGIQVGHQVWWTKYEAHPGGVSIEKTSVQTGRLIDLDPLGMAVS